MEYSLTTSRGKTYEKKFRGPKLGFLPISQGCIISWNLHPLCLMWFQSGTFIYSIIVLNLNISFNFCARLGFNVIWFVQCMKIRKSKIEIKVQFIDTMHYQVSPLSYTRSTSESFCSHFCRRQFLL